MNLTALTRRIVQSLRWRLGMRVAAPELESGKPDQIARFYDARVTECRFLSDPAHYEHPRARWVVDRVSGGSLLEVGCGDGGMTAQLAPRVETLLALDVSRPSLAALAELRLANVRTAHGMVESFASEQRFDHVVMSEVVEHLPHPRAAVEAALRFLGPGGRLLITTPHGHWESDEHLHEFSFSSFLDLFPAPEVERLEVGYIRDRENRRRWLCAVAERARTPPATDDFFSAAAMRRRRTGAEGTRRA
jgi:ubiquinone/menaquinone biosynthesis C-methylase UbiE